MKTLKKYTLLPLACFVVIFSGVVNAYDIPTVHKELDTHLDSISSKLTFYGFQLAPKTPYAVVCTVRNLSKTEKAYISYGPYGDTQTHKVYVDGKEQSAYEIQTLGVSGAKDDARILASTGVITSTQPKTVAFSVENWGDFYKTQAMVDAICTMMAQ